MLHQRLGTALCQHLTGGLTILDVVLYLLDVKCQATLTVHPESTAEWPVAIQCDCAGITRWEWFVTKKYMDQHRLQYPDVNPWQLSQLYISAIYIYI